MKNKIREGKVPGVTDPAEASRLIRRGHLTYTRARNITRFGTIESVTYDIAEGSVVSLAAGGISFALTASVFWLSTGDRDAALQTAAVQQENLHPHTGCLRHNPATSPAQCCSGYAEAY